MKVMIVDDNEDVAVTTTIFFQALGCETVVKCTDPHKVLELVKSQTPDIIVMDIGMPDINGYELCQILRKEGFTNIKIVAHTGWGTKEDIEKAYKAGFDEVLIKPVEMAEYERILRETDFKNDMPIQRPPNN